MDRGRNIAGENTVDENATEGTERTGHNADLGAKSLRERTADGHVSGREATGEEGADDRDQAGGCTPGTAEEIDPREAGGP